MSIERMKHEAIEAVLQDYYRPVITVNLPIGEAVHLAVERCKKRGSRRHENVDSDMNRALRIPLEQIRVPVHGTVFEIATDPRNRARRFDTLQNRRILFRLAHAFQFVVGRGQFHIDRVGCS